MYTGGHLYTANAITNCCRLHASCSTAPSTITTRCTQQDPNNLLQIPLVTHLLPHTRTHSCPALTALHQPHSPALHCPCCQPLSPSLSKTTPWNIPHTQTPCRHLVKCTAYCSAAPRGPTQSKGLPNSHLTVGLDTQHPVTPWIHSAHPHTRRHQVHLLTDQPTASALSRQSH